VRGALPVTDDHIARGLESARIKGRFDRLQVVGAGGAGRVEWVFDVAHNPAAARLFSEALAGLDRVPRTIAVFGAMADKDIAAVVRPFVEVVDAWLVGGVDSDRGAEPEALAALLGREGARDVTVFEDIPSAVRAALGMPADRVLVFGSFYTVGPAMQVVEIY
jgi:dihydrofolate synthase / folylpolyglutamate synthase